MMLGGRPGCSAKGSIMHTALMRGKVRLLSVEGRSIKYQQDY